jgi:hypothetical protein
LVEVQYDWAKVVAKFGDSFLGENKRNFARKLDQTSVWGLIQLSMNSPNNAPDMIICRFIIYLFIYIFFPGGWFSILWCNQTGECQQEDLTKIWL